MDIGSATSLLTAVAALGSERVDTESADVEVHQMRHVAQDTTEATNPWSDLPTPEVKKFADLSKGKGKGKVKRNCWYWEQNGTCRFGVNCTFAHLVEADQASDKGKGKGDTAKHGSLRQQSVPAPPPPPSVPKPPAPPPAAQADDPDFPDLRATLAGSARLDRLSMPRAKNSNSSGPAEATSGSNGTSPWTYK